MYLLAADGDNPFGLYSSTRSIVELSAFTHEVSRRLMAITEKGEEWQSRGIAYFGALVQARFGTGDSRRARSVQDIVDNGDATHFPKPIHVNDGLRSLSKVPRFTSVLAEYERLCDFVHHNLGSQALTAEGYYIAQEIVTSGGGGFRAAKPGPVTRYSYPVRLPAEEALRWTAPIALTHSRAVVEWHNSMAPTPFTSAELKELTGSELGMGVEWSDEKVRSGVPKVNRNSQCPCGSGMKYKRCHGRS
jgi:hypothetical protein